MAGACSVCVRRHDFLNGRRSGESDSAKHARGSGSESGGEYDSGKENDGKSDFGKDHDGENDSEKESVCDDDGGRNYEKANVCDGDANDCPPHDDDSSPNDDAIVPCLSSFAAVP